MEQKIKTNWFKVVSLILIGVIIGYTISIFWLNQPQVPIDVQPLCVEWVKSLIETGYLQIIQP